MSDMMLVFCLLFDIRCTHPATATCWTTRVWCSTLTTSTRTALQVTGVLQQDHQPDCGMHNGGHKGGVRQVTVHCWHKNGLCLIGAPASQPMLYGCFCRKCEVHIMPCSRAGLWQSLLSPSCSVLWQTSCTAQSPRPRKSTVQLLCHPP